ncbi:Elongator complex protein 4 [Tolypocladium ophioglossoides CBS 100239]|uniref:Elongator complex protein 4 n=1 Tax=Tolypocladium ophioglossoides (strain CBS 100239) TaxID=1163406 RepID=A0A0L0NBG4_TOLOC|nr:Elongator complex protein 4 [Tolypocladium ophioglossoides CBS 100239]
MSFRKRNTVIRAPAALDAPRQEKALCPGTRPSPLDGRLTTSTGTASLDQLLAGHAGIPLGSSLLIEEAGTTDFAGTLLRYCAAEGLVQGHHVHLLGAGDVWRGELPGLASEAKPSAAKAGAASPDKMKIAWRYEALGNNSTPVRDVQAGSAPYDEASPFCHAFDLTKRLETSAIRGQLHSFRPTDALSRSAQPPFRAFFSDVASRLKGSPSLSVHRILVPSLLSPTLYSSAACQPQEVLQFLHSLRSLLRQFPTRTTALVTLPESLHPRSAGLTKWMELLFDGVIEVIPLQHRAQMGRGPTDEDKIQGLLRVHSLPVFHEKGGGLEGGWVREDMSFKLSALSGMVIMPFSLPPVGDGKAAEPSGTSADSDKKQLLDY